MITDITTSTLISPVTIPYPPPVVGPAEIAILQNVLMWGILVFLPILLAWGIATWKKHLEQLRQHENWQDLQGIVNIAVNAAEQLGLTEQLSSYGGDKLEYAVGLVETLLESRGLNLDLDEPIALIKTLIEAEVKKL